MYKNVGVLFFPVVCMLRDFEHTLRGLQGVCGMICVLLKQLLECVELGNRPFYCAEDLRLCLRVICNGWGNKQVSNKHK